MQQQNVINTTNAITTYCFKFHPPFLSPEVLSVCRLSLSIVNLLAVPLLSAAAIPSSARPKPLRSSGLAGVRPIRHNAKPQFCASTTVSLHYVWHGSLLSRSFIACNLCVEVVVVCSAFSCECDCCSWVLVSISCNHILDVTPPYNSGFLKWNHMIFNELKNW